MGLTLAVDEDKDIVIDDWGDEVEIRPVEANVIRVVEEEAGVLVIKAVDEGVETIIDDCELEIDTIP